MLIQTAVSLLLIAVEGSEGAKLRWHRVTPATHACEDGRGSRRITENKYILHTESVSWFTAKERCEADGGVLAKPSTCSEKQAVRALLAEVPPANASPHVTNELHAGFFRPDYFITVFGSSLFEVGYQRWAPDQENPQICGTFNHNLLLYDAKCLDKRSFVCEISPKAKEKKMNITSAPLYVESLKEEKYQPIFYKNSSWDLEWTPLMQQGRMHWYSFMSLKEDWANAKRLCKNHGGHLVIIDHQAEANALQEYVKTLENVTDLLYVGFHNGDNMFISLFGSEVQDGWEREQPDDETCLAVSHEMLLEKVPCWRKLNFICELTFIGPDV